MTPPDTTPPKPPRTLGQLGLQLLTAAIGVEVLNVIGSIVVNTIKTSSRRRRSLR